jgi:hypothetical protein
MSETSFMLTTITNRTWLLDGARKLRVECVFHYEPAK